MVRDSLEPVTAGSRSLRNFRQSPYDSSTTLFRYQEALAMQLGLFAYAAHI